MNVLLWFLQVLLAMLSIAAGAYKVLADEQLIAYGRFASGPRVA